MSRKNHNHRGISPALICSGILNVALATILVYWTVEETPPTPYCTVEPQITPPPLLATDYTNQELFHTLQEQQVTHLANTFFETPEFQNIASLFRDTKIPVEKEELLDMLCEGDWKMLISFLETEENGQQSVIERRKRLLREYLAGGSTTAAWLILKTDPKYALQEEETQKLPEQVYTVQEGDSLWKISKNFHVSIASLKEHNALSSDVINPGKTLRIP